ncbi:aldo/keto reductase, partial [bacterium]
MKRTILGPDGPEVTRLSYGAMRIAGSWDPQNVDREGAFAALHAAYDAGYTLFDHADIYARGACETLHGEFLRENPSLRDQTIIATKCGIRFGDEAAGVVGRYDFSPEWILQSCDGSLARLGIETIDLYQLHRPDLLMDPELVAEAFETLHKAGKVRAFGVSNFLPSTVDLLQEFLPSTLLVNQIEVHLGRLDPFFDGTLDQCLRTGMTPLAWSPLGGGWIGAAIEDAPPE